MIHVYFFASHFWKTYPLQSHYFETFYAILYTQYFMYISVPNNSPQDIHILFIPLILILAQPLSSVSGLGVSFGLFIHFRIYKKGMIYAASTFVAISIGYASSNINGALHCVIVDDLELFRSLDHSRCVCLVSLLNLPRLFRCRAGASMYGKGVSAYWETKKIWYKPSNKRKNLLVFIILAIILAIHIYRLDLLVL